MNEIILDTIIFLIVSSCIGKKIIPQIILIGVIIVKLAEDVNNITDTNSIMQTIMFSSTLAYAGYLAIMAGIEEKDEDES